MGNNLFGANISGIIAREIGPGVLPAQLHKKTTTTARTSGNLTGGRTSSTSTTPCRGFVDEYEERQIDETKIQRGDRRITLLGDTIAAGTVVPEQGDKITIEGRVYKVVNVRRDPDAATYECQARG